MSLKRKKEGFSDRKRGVVILEAFDEPRPQNSHQDAMPMAYVGNAGLFPMHLNSVWTPLSKFNFTTRI